MGKVTFASTGGPGTAWARDAECVGVSGGRKVGARGGCEAGAVALVWVTGNSGAGKSTVCAELQRRGELAVDADWEGYSHWVDRVSGSQS